MGERVDNYNQYQSKCLTPTTTPSANFNFTHENRELCRWGGVSRTNISSRCHQQFNPCSLPMSFFFLITTIDKKGSPDESDVTELLLNVCINLNWVSMSYLDTSHSSVDSLLTSVCRLQCTVSLMLNRRILGNHPCKLNIGTRKANWLKRLWMSLLR